MECLSSFQAADAFLFGEIVTGVIAVIDAVPGFDADVGCAGLSPQTQTGCATEIHMDVPAVFPAEGTTLGLQSVENQRIRGENGGGDDDVGAVVQDR